MNEFECASCGEICNQLYSADSQMVCEECYTGWLEEKDDM